MLAPRELPSHFQQWNRKWKAPFGIRHPLGGMLPWHLRPLVNGCFSMQRNNSIRLFEYPWAFHAASLESGMNVVEIGGGLSGFQFVLDKTGCRVTNVDPGPPSSERSRWRCTAGTIGHLNRLFGTSVTMRNVMLNEAVLEPESCDRAFSISVLEHFNKADINRGSDLVYQALKPGGLFILTVDLFLDIEPFTDQKSNVHGANMNIHSMLDGSRFSLVHGNPESLYGFGEFKPESVLANLSKYLCGTVYPALAQCIVLKK